jgi:hypothetical protein
MVRDSLGYLITSSGRILASATNFTDTLRHDTINKTPNFLYVGISFMIDSVLTSVDNETVVAKISRHLDLYGHPTLSPLDTSYYDRLYVDTIGLISAEFANGPFGSPKHKKVLRSYHIEK